jgi:hypothetical protein
VQNGTLVYPQQGQTAQVPAGATSVVTVAGQKAANKDYFYKPEFRGTRLTAEQMDPAGAAAAASAAAVLQAQQQQQATTMMVQPGVVTGLPVMSAWAPTGPNNAAAKPPQEFSYAHPPPVWPAAAGIQGFGLPNYAANPLEGASYAHSLPPAPAAAGITGFGVQNHAANPPEGVSYAPVSADAGFPGLVVAEL